MCTCVHNFMHCLLVTCTLYICTHPHVHTCTCIYTQSQGLESATMKEKEQNEPMFKAIEFAPTLTEGGHFETIRALSPTLHACMHVIGNNFIVMMIQMSTYPPYKHTHALKVYWTCWCYALMEWCLSSGILEFGESLKVVVLTCSEVSMCINKAKQLVSCPTNRSVSVAASVTLVCVWMCKLVRVKVYEYDLFKSYRYT